MSWTDWDITKPIDHTLIKDLPGAIRDAESATKVIVSKEHVAPGTSNDGGQHVKGSGRVFLQSGHSVLDPEGNSLATGVDTSDNGRLSVDTALSNTLKVYVATSVGVSTGWQNLTIRVVSLEQAMAVNGNPVNGLSAATQTDQPVALGQVNTTYLNLTDPSTSATIGVRLVGTYLAASGQEGITVKSVQGKDDWIGSWYAVDSLGATLAKATTYQASSAGFVVVSLVNSNEEIKGLTGWSNPPTTLRLQSCGYSDASAGDKSASFTLPVKKGDYWQVTSGGSPTIYWSPLGASSAPVAV